jgi:hypothetical protein
MRVQRVLMPGSGAESWTLLGEDHVPVEPVERFLAFLAAVERSPNTVKAYAHDLKDWFGFLAGRGGQVRGGGVSRLIRDSSGVVRRGWRCFPRWSTIARRRV